MLFDFKLAALLAILGAALCEAVDSVSASNLTLYAYGTNITGLTVFYGDGMNNGPIYLFLSLYHNINYVPILTIALGLAYIGTTPLSGESVASNITCILHLFESFSSNSNILYSLYYRSCLGDRDLEHHVNKLCV